MVSVLPNRWHGFESIAKSSFSGFSKRREMKGQMIFEFIVATMLFIGVVFYVIFMLNSTVYAYSGDYYKNARNSEALRVSELLVGSPGVWDASTPKLVGLAENWPVINDTKIAYLDAFCKANKDKIQELLDLNDGRGDYRPVRIVISNNTNAFILSCGEDHAGFDQGYSERFAFSPASGIVKIGVGVW